MFVGRNVSRPADMDFTTWTRMFVRGSLQTPTGRCYHVIDYMSVKQYKIGKCYCCFVTTTTVYFQCIITSVLSAVISQNDDIDNNVKKCEKIAHC